VSPSIGMSCDGAKIRLEWLCEARPDEWRSGRGDILDARGVGKSRWGLGYYLRRVDITSPQCNCDAHPRELSFHLNFNFNFNSRVLVKGRMNHTHARMCQRGYAMLTPAGEAPGNHAHRPTLHTHVPSPVAILSAIRACIAALKGEGGTAKAQI
jgi:hypothetical protein